MGITSIPSSITMFPMPQEALKQKREVVIAEKIGRTRVLTLNQPNSLNFLSIKEIFLLAQKFEKYEKDDNAEFVIIKGAGRTFSVGGDLKGIYDHRNKSHCCIETIYRMYWLCYHIHTYKKPHIALVHGMSVGGGASLMTPMKFSIITEKAFFSTPETSLGFHPDCGFSYMYSRLPGVLGEYLGLTGVKLRGNEVVAAGLATHFVPSQEVEAGKKGNEWIVPVLKSLKKASPIGLKMTLRSIREGRTQTLSECLRREFRITINTLRTIISGDFYEGIRAALIDKDKSPKWNPSTLDKVHDEHLDLIFKPFEEHNLELQIPIKEEECRWGGKYENSGYYLQTN